MDELNLEQDITNFTKTHEEILELIAEIKEFEEKYPEYYLDKTDEGEELIEIKKDATDFIEIGQGEAEFIEVEPDVVEFIEVGQDSSGLPTFYEVETEQEGLVDGVKKSKIFRIRSRDKYDAQMARLEKKAATFKLRFDDKGNLVNIDLKKPKLSKPKTESKKGSKFKIPKIKRRRKSEEKGGETEAAEKKSKLKGGLGKIGKLKRVIPSKGKKKGKSEE